MTINKAVFYAGLIVCGLLLGLFIASTQEKEQTKLIATLKQSITVNEQTIAEQKQLIFKLKQTTHTVIVQNTDGSSTTTVDTDTTIDNTQSTNTQTQQNGSTVNVNEELQKETLKVYSKFSAEAGYFLTSKTGYISGHYMLIGRVGIGLGLRSNLKDFDPLVSIVIK